MTCPSNKKHTRHQGYGMHCGLSIHTKVKFYNNIPVSRKSLKVTFISPYGVNFCVCHVQKRVQEHSIQPPVNTDYVTSVEVQQQIRQESNRTTHVTESTFLHVLDLLIILVPSIFSKFFFAHIHNLDFQQISPQKRVQS